MADFIIYDLPSSIFAMLWTTYAKLIYIIRKLVLFVSLLELFPRNTNHELGLISSHMHVMGIATAAYVICLVGIIMMYIWYTPDTSCLLNIFFITWTLVLLQLMTSVSLHPKVSPQ